MTKYAAIRHATIEDYPDIAGLMSESRPDYPRTADDLRYADVHRPEHCKHQFFVAEKDGVIVGFALYTQHADLYHPQQFHVNVYVKEDASRKGIGWSLYKTMYQQVMQFSPSTLYSRVTEDNTIGYIFASKRGFMETSQRIESRLDTATAHLDKLAERLKILSGQGIEIRSYADLADDPERDKKLHAIHSTVDADVPLETPVTPLDFEAWRPNVIEHPQFLAEGTFVAIHNGHYVGLSTLFQFVDDMAYVELTGTLPDYRRKGISTALKLSGIAYAKAQNIARVGVTNDAINTGILEINRKLGFVPEPAIINLKLSIES